LFRYLAILLLTLVSSPAFSEEGDLDTVIKGVEQAYKGVGTLRADFVQVTRSKAMGDETKQRGRVMLKRPKMMRWEFTQPAGKMFVTNGDTMWVWSAAEKQVIVSKGAAGGGQGMAQLLDDLNRLGELFDAELLSSEGKANTVSLLLKPKSDAGFQSLTLRLAANDYTVKEVNMLDAFGNEVELSFKQVKNNVEIDDSQFNFQVPAGAQVLNADGP
jgi:outer membrane lipoprotein carrier protein